MNFFGLFLGIAALMIIGLGFVWVIKAEYCLGYLWWPYFTGLGFVFLAASLFVQSIWVSALMGVIGASFVWGSTEFKEQAVRAEIGWYPFNPHPKPKPPLYKWIKKLPAPHL